MILLSERCFCLVSILQHFYLVLFAHGAVDYTELGLVIPIYAKMCSCVSVALRQLKLPLDKNPQISVAENNKYLFLTFATCPLWVVRMALFITKWPEEKVQPCFQMWSVAM